MSKKLVLLVEGHTEYGAVGAFLKRWLDARLAQPVGVQAIRFDGWQDLLTNAPRRARLFLDEIPNRSEIIAVIGLIDLYGPTFYPDDINSVPERYAWGRAHIEKLVSHPGYHQFFAVHETEAWLLSDLQRFQPDVRKALIEKSKNPETINFDEPPAKLLDRVYMSCKKRHYEKVIEARNHFPHLDPSVAATKCPYLRQMLNELLTIIQDARTQGPHNYA